MAQGDEIFWGLTTANLLTAFGVAVSLGFNVINYSRTNAVRTKSLDLDHFNSRARKPIEEALLRMEDCVDAFHSLAQTAPPYNANELANLSKQFHVSRRALDRRLNELQRSKLNVGDNWISMQHADSDNASDAIEQAVHANTTAQMLGAYTAFNANIIALCNRLRDKLDKESQRLMK